MWIKKKSKKKKKKYKVIFLILKHNFNLYQILLYYFTILTTPWKKVDLSQVWREEMLQRSSRNTISEWNTRVYLQAACFLESALPGVVVTKARVPLPTGRLSLGLHPPAIVPSTHHQTRTLLYYIIETPPSLNTYLLII